MKQKLSRLRFLLRRLRERLWVKPMGFCILSVAAAFVAKAADGTFIATLAPDLKAESIEVLLSVMAASMLVIATLAVTSMVSAYASASSTATPRSFALVVSDDVSQNALSIFIGAFIFSIVALTALKNDYFEAGARFTLFVLMTAVFAVVILTFVRWVDRIARLGRLGNIIDKAEHATAQALKRRIAAPTLCGVAVDDTAPASVAVESEVIGYVQHIDMEALQAWACSASCHLSVAALPGTFAVPGRAIARLDREPSGEDLAAIRKAFVIGNTRMFDDDPRFGLVVLGEIAGRALSPGINDPGTAIDIVGRLTRVLAQLAQPPSDLKPQCYDRIVVPMLVPDDLFDDAFSVIARDGAGAIEVAIRLQKALNALAVAGDGRLRAVAARQRERAMMRASRALAAEDMVALRAVAGSG